MFDPRVVGKCEVVVFVSVGLLPINKSCQLIMVMFLNQDIQEWQATITFHFHDELDAGS